VVLVFARAPVPGRAKTRLIPALGEAGAAALHRRLLHRTVGVAAEVADCDVQLWCTPDTRHHEFQRLARRFHCGLQPQRGDDLGQRMAYALQQALAQYPRAIIIGSDCPALSAADIEQGFAMLERSSDAVIGPAADGGYYLLGLGRFEPALFHAVEWGSDRVLEQTLLRMEQSALHCTRLSVKHDLDRPDDLEHFPQLLEH
jgi:rSAM/selenodomain-associated transferase 1